MNKGLKNLPISKRLFFTFAVILAVFFVTVLLAVFGLFSTGKNFDSFYNESYAIADKANTLKADIEIVAKYIGYSMMEENVQKTAEYIEAAKDKISELREGTAFMKENLKQPENLNIIEKYDTVMKTIMEDRDMVFELAEQNKNTEAVELYFNKVRPSFVEANEYLIQIRDSASKDAIRNYTTASSQKNIITIVLLILSVLTFVITVLMARYIIKSITRPIMEIELAAKEMATGSLNVSLTYESADEMGSLASSMRVLIKKMKEIIQDIGRILAGLADGDFHITSNCLNHYVKDYVPILQSMRLIRDNLNNTMLEINEATQQVAVGASQMAESAQSLAEGATEQAGAIEELTASVENVASMAENSSDKTKAAYEQIRLSAEKAENSKQEMEEMRVTMERINTTSKKIETIIAEIEDIASQTNLLSLNASIEAARAGEAGRGFAVVADQIGKLASDSAQSAVNTRELIGKSMKEIEVGNSITMNTAGIFEEVIGEMKAFAVMAKDTSEISIAQYENLKQIQVGIEQISNVVQSNSAAAEETSATSEELSAQTENLNAQIGKFKLLQ